jgi:hypothetical protein
MGIGAKRQMAVDLVAENFHVRKLPDLTPDKGCASIPAPLSLGRRGAVEYNPKEAGDFPSCF